METARAKLTVLFDPPFWVGIFERENGGRYEACRVVFGAEPRDFEVYAYILDHYDRLDFSPALQTETAAERELSPKRAQRLARRQTQSTGIGTKAQQALQLQREQSKTERRALSREAREAEEARRYRLRQEKRKEKHRGH
ncbi:MAG: YjdF family protein [Oscillibacter sp.]|nr:YjdF family protein [Oscillibacter sp.]